MTYLIALSGPANEGFWLDREALDSDERWARIRERARAVLAAFDWPDEAPALDAATYVGDGVVLRNI
jgi:hypothetical protein